LQARRQPNKVSSVAHAHPEAEAQNLETGASVWCMEF